MEMPRSEPAKRLRSGGLVILAVLLAVSSGCGGSGSGSSGKSTPLPAATQYNNYAGVQSVTRTLGNGDDPIAGGVWSLTFDDSSHYFYYLDISDPPNFLLGLPSTPVGSFALADDFLDLTLNGASPGGGGYALEIPGRAALMRPYNSSILPVVAVAANSCTVLPASTTYQFIVLGVPRFSASDTDPQPAYGSVKASTQGATWNFSNFGLYQVDGTSMNPSAIATGTCGLSPEGYVVSVPENLTTRTEVMAAIEPSGFFILAQTPVQWLVTTSEGLSDSDQLALAGVAEPSSQLDTGTVVAGKYAGLEYAPLANSLSSGGNTVAFPVDQLVAFGQAAGTGTAMTGGAFPNDDVTKSPAADTTIDFGAQDPKNNGLYKSVVVTIPDPTGSCIARPYGGADASGNPTCIFPGGVAVVGNPEGKYAIFVTVNDLRATTFGYATSALQLFLYQQ